MRKAVPRGDPLVKVTLVEDEDPQPPIRAIEDRLTLHPAKKHPCLYLTYQIVRKNASHKPRNTHMCCQPPFHASMPFFYVFVYTTLVFASLHPERCILLFCGLNLSVVGHKIQPLPLLLLSLMRPFTSTNPTPSVAQSVVKVLRTSSFTKSTPCIGKERHIHSMWLRAHCNVFAVAAPVALDCAKNQMNYLAPATIRPVAT